MSLDPIKVEAALRARKVPETEIKRILALFPKPEVEPEPLTPAEQAIVRQQKEDDAKAPEYKMRLVASYHRRANSAGRHNPLIRLREIEEIQKDRHVRGASRFEGAPIR